MVFLVVVLCLASIPTLQPLAGKPAKNDASSSFPLSIQFAFRTLFGIEVCANVTINSTTIQVGDLVGVLNDSIDHIILRSVKATDVSAYSSSLLVVFHGAGLRRAAAISSANCSVG